MDLKIADRTFKSRLFIGTGKFPSVEEMIKAVDKSGTELVTVALRRMDVNSSQDEFIENLEKKKHTE